MATPNLQHSDKWSIIISNIPGYTPSVGDNTDIGLYELYVKEMTFPDLSLELVQSHFVNYEINHQISKINDTLNDLQITFKVSSGLLNYYHISKYMREMREMRNPNNDKWFRLNFIKEIKVIFMDNDKRPVTKMSFINGFITNLSSLNLTNGVDEEMTFTITIKYEDHSLELIERC